MNATEAAQNEEKKRHEYVVEVAATRRANGNPFPGPLADAFLKGSIRVGELPVRKVVAIDWMLLGKIKSPLYEIVQELKQNPTKIPDVKFDEQQKWDLCFLFTNHPEVSDNLIEKGLVEFQHASKAQIGMNPDIPGDSGVDLLLAAVMLQVQRSWSTVVQFKEKAEETENVRFFQEADPKPTTA